MIVAVAIRREGLIFTMPAPARHHTVLNHMAQKEKIDALDVDQGFLTSGGQYVTRQQAHRIACKCGQVKDLNGQLFSEDLW